MMILFFNFSFSYADSSIQDFENDENIVEKINNLKADGWEKLEGTQILRLHHFYYTNTSQEEAKLLIIPIRSQTTLRSSCMAALFTRGSNPNFTFKEFSQISGYCME
jgi:hypothetical protein